MNHTYVLRRSVYRPYPDELFSARNANVWRELVQQWNQESGSWISLPSDGQAVLRSRRGRDLVGRSNFELWAMLDSISAVACEYQEPFLTTPHLAQKY
jgi:hypothetical protein